jgi:hypothetical protein
MDLSGVFRALEGGTLLDYENALNFFDLKSMPADDADHFLVDLLDICQTAGSNAKAVATLARWQAIFWNSIEYDPYSPQKGDVPLAVISRLFSLAGTPLGTLSYVARLFADRLSPFELLHELATAPPSPVTEQALDAVFRVFGLSAGSEFPSLTPLSVGDLETLRAEAYDAQNMEAYDFLTDAIRRASGPAEKPEWLGNFTNDAELPFVDEIAYPPVLTLSDVVELWSPERVAEFMVAGKESFGIPGVDFAQQLSYLRGLSPEAYRATVAPLVLARERAQLQDNEALFRILGPVNPKIDFDLALEHPCAAYGGCRMFICRCSETYDEGEEDDEQLYSPDDEGKFHDLTSWFTGSCDYCQRKIASPYHAVRLPIPVGGWRGTYCSFDHVRGAVAEGINRPEDIQCQPGRCTAVSHEDLQIKIIDLLEEEVRSVGIQDRLTDSEPAT